jgi:hypothetical protein
MTLFDPFFGRQQLAIGAALIAKHDRLAIRAVLIFLKLQLAQIAVGLFAAVSCPRRTFLGVCAHIRRKRRRQTGVC